MTIGAGMFRKRIADMCRVPDVECIYVCTTAFCRRLLREGDPSAAFAESEMAPDEPTCIIPCLEIL
jgi:hypothetical protein